MPNYLYVDNSNVWIEGMHVAAVQHGLAPDIWTAMEQKICDQSWKLDFGRLHRFAGGDDKEVARAVLFGTRPPPNDSLWKSAERKGFEVVVYDRNIRNKEKKVDTRIATEIMADSYERMKAGQDEVTIVSGDSDYVPTVEQLRGRGFNFHVVFWEHAAKELKDVASSLVNLDQYLEHLNFAK